MLHLESCTRDLGEKTSPLLMGRREVVCNICSHALEFGWVRLSPCQSAGEKWFATSVIMHWSFGYEDYPLANEQEISGLQYLKSCSGVWEGKTLP